MSAFYINPAANTVKRFDMSVFMPYTDNYDPLVAEFFRMLPNITTSGRYKVQTEDSRPELISNKLYGDTQYWWILLQYNGIAYVDDLKVGMSLNFPSLSDLESLYFSLASKARA